MTIISEALEADVEFFEPQAVVNAKNLYKGCLDTGKMARWHFVKHE